MASPTIDTAENIITKIKECVDDVFKFRDEFVVVRGLEAAGSRDQEVEIKMKEALKQVEVLVQHQDVRSGSALGRVLYERGRLLSLVPSQAAAAEQDLSRASKFGVKGAWTLLGECLYNKGDLPAAATCFNRTLSTGEDQVALRNLSMLMRGLPTNTPEQREENINKGVEYARRAVKQDPADGQSWMVLGNSLFSSFFAGHGSTTTLQACKAAYARAEHDKKASVLPELHLSKHQVAWYEEQYSAALSSVKTACQLEPSWQECQVKRQQCLKFLRTLVVMVAKKGHLSNKRLQTMIKSIKPNQLGPYEHSGTAISGSNKPELVSFSQLVLNTNTDKIVQGMVVSTLVPESGIPFVMCLVDSEGTCLPVSVYNWAPGSEVKIGDAVAVVAPVLKEQTLLLESEDGSPTQKTGQDKKKIQSAGSKKAPRNTTARKVGKVMSSAKSKKESGPPEEEAINGDVDAVKKVKEEEMEKKEPDKAGEANMSDNDQKKSETTTLQQENESKLSNQNATEAATGEDKNNTTNSTEEMEQNETNSMLSDTKDSNENKTESSSGMQNVKEENCIESGHDNINGNVEGCNPVDNLEEVAMDDEMNKNTIRDGEISSKTPDTLQADANEPASKVARTEAGAAVASAGTGSTGKTRPQTKGGATSTKPKETRIEKKMNTTLPRRTPATNSSNSNNNIKNAMLNRSATDKEPSSGVRKTNALNATKSPVVRSSEKVQPSGSKPRASGLLKKQGTPSSSKNSNTLSNTTSDASKNVKANVLPTRKINVNKSVVSNVTKSHPKDTSSPSAKSSNAVPRVPESSSNNVVKCDSRSNSNTPSNKSSAAASDGGVGAAKKPKQVLGRREAKTASLAGDKQRQVASDRKPSGKTGSAIRSVQSSEDKSSPSTVEESGEVLLRSLRVVAPVMLVVNKRQVMAGQVAASYLVSQNKPE